MSQLAFDEQTGRQLEAVYSIARRRCESHGNAAFQEADATALPVEDASFDGALCVQVLEYVRDYPSALAELHRALRPGGRAVVWDTDRATVSWHSTDPSRMRRVLPLIEDFAAGRRGLAEADVRQWAAEQRELDERGEFFFSYTQFCCKARPHDSRSA